MGLLRNTNALPYKKILKVKNELKIVGVKQFIRIYHLCRNRFHNTFVWGDEIEVMLVARYSDGVCGDKDSDTKNNQEPNPYIEKLPSQQPNLYIEKLPSQQPNPTYADSKNNQQPNLYIEKLPNLYIDSKNNQQPNPTLTLNNRINGYKLLLAAEHFTANLKSKNALFTPEFASYMVESTPKIPYTSKVSSLLEMEINMIERIRCIKNEMKRLKIDGFPLLMTVFPNIGYGNAFYGQGSETGETSNDTCNIGDNESLLNQFFLRGKNLTYKITKSYFFPDNAITNHFRFFSFVKNIRNRRNKQIEGYICIMRDKNTKLTTLLPYRGVNDKDSKLEGFSGKGSKLEGFNDKESRLEGVNDKDIKLEGFSDKGSKLEGFNDKESRLESVNDKDSKLEGVSDKDSALESISDKDSYKDNYKGVNDKDSGLEGVNENTNKQHPFNKSKRVNGILIDSMGQGMGCCCLQVTLQASELEEARLIYDQLAVMCPLLLRLTRATPIAQGRLLNTETRWDMLVYSVDCRTDSERGSPYERSGFDGCECGMCNGNKKDNYQTIGGVSGSELEGINNSNDKQPLVNITTITTDKQHPVNTTTITTDKQHPVNTTIKNTDKQHTVNTTTINTDQQHLSTQRIFKSRFSSIDMFISQSELNLKEYNDIKVPLNIDTYNLLINNNVDKLMAEHISSLFVRDPILVYEDSISRIEESNNTTSHNNTNNNLCLDEFENIQSSNWRSMRFKLPDITGGDMSGWKVEVRPMELQPTCFENSAFCVFVVLLSRAIISYQLNFYLPISFVDENFRRANLLRRRVEEYECRGCRKCSGTKPSDINTNIYHSLDLSDDSLKFYYRKNIYEKGNCRIEEGNLKEIFCGKGEYPGILSVVCKFVREHCGDNQGINKYLEFIRKKVCGEVMSVSDWIRGFVVNHRGYCRDSVVGEEIVSDLVEEFKKIEEVNDYEYLKVRR